MADVKLWRYSIPSQDMEGWATVVLGSDGFFAATTEYGDYAHQWPAPAMGMREFVAQVHPEYLLGKIAHHLMEFDAKATEKRIREHVTKLKGKERAKELELLDECDISEQGKYGFTTWCMGTNTCDPCEDEVMVYPADARAFATKTMPRLAAMIRAELEAEKTEVR